ncbi:MAG: cysteine desulfurase [Candidatus Aminicenantes bacterium]|nr:cysteine desulfurase [Candidatus Aminicenantes bacterium]
MKRIYLDHIACTPIRSEVVNAMLPYLQNHFGNAQSLHQEGQIAAQAIEEAREKVAALIGAQPAEIYFTASGSEANNLAIKGIALARKDKGKHIVVSAIEHQSVLHSVKFLEKLGFEATQVPVDQYGLVEPEEVKKALRSDTILVSVMMANSEVGTIEPIKEIAAFCQERDIPFHTDAVAACGNIPVDVRELGVSSLSLAAHQFYGPKGAAALYLKKGTRILPLIDGGIQEGGRRAGTEDVAAIVGLGKAAEIAQHELTQWAEQLRPLRDYLLKELPSRIPHVLVTGHPERRLPHHASFCIEFIEGEAMLLNLDLKGFAASSGSACTSRALKASHVLLAMGLDHAIAQGSIVFSLVKGITREDIEELLAVFPPIVDRLRKMSPLYTQFMEGKKS